MGIKRRTPSVDLLMKEFHNSNGAISVIELVNRLQMQINKTTIYRVLDKLEDDGVLHSFLDKNGSKCYAMCSDCSKHIIRIDTLISNVLNVVKWIVFKLTFTFQMSLTKK